MPTRAITLFLLGLAGLTAVVLVLTAASAADTPFLPGITVKDENPNGCVDCHKNAGAGKDYRLSVSLPANVKGHPDISKSVKAVPTDCTLCHAAGRNARPLQKAVHEVHYEKPAENAFVTVYKGACLNCHVLSADGTVSVKAAARNW